LVIFANRAREPPPKNRAGPDGREATGLQHAREILPPLHFSFFRHLFHSAIGHIFIVHNDEVILHEAAATAAPEPTTINTIIVTTVVAQAPPRRRSSWRCTSSSSSQPQTERDWRDVADSFVPQFHDVGGRGE
jgi:hypothetical protein